MTAAPPTPPSIAIGTDVRAWQSRTGAATKCVAAPARLDRLVQRCAIRCALRWPDGPGWLPGVGLAPVSAHDLP